MQHPDTERIIERFTGGVTYRYEPTVAIADIHLTDAERQNIRPGGLDHDKVEQYAQAMSNGDDFPALVLYSLKKGGYDVLGGMHRIEAAKRTKRTDFDAYIVDLDEKQDERTIEVLQRTLNMFHGSGYGKEERILHGIRLLGLGYSVDDTAKMVAVSATTLRSRQDAAAARLRLADLKLKMPTSEISLVELGRIKNDDLFKASVELTNAAKLSADTVKDLSKEVRTKASEREAWTVIRSWQANLEDTVKASRGGRIKSPTAPSTRAIDALQRAERLIRPEVFAGLVEYERDKAVKQIRTATQAIQRTLAEVIASKAEKKRA